MSDLDALIDLFVSDAQLADGRPSAYLAARGEIVRPMPARALVVRPARWTEEEEQFYLEHIGRWTYDQIAAALGRSVEALHIHATRHGLPLASRVPGYLTTHRVAEILGVDSHKPPMWVDHGILPGERVATREGAYRFIRRVSWMQFKLWLVRPTSWVYFDARKMKHDSLRSLVLRAQARWGDEWLTTAQAGKIHNCPADDIERQIQRGRISGFQAPHIGARDRATWSLWFVRRSEVERLVIPRGRGKGVEDIVWSARADAFLIRMRAAGKTWTEIGRMMKWTPQRCSYRWHSLKKKGRV